MVYHPGHTGIVGDCCLSCQGTDFPSHISRKRRSHSLVASLARPPTSELDVSPKGQQWRRDHNSSHLHIRCHLHHWTRWWHQPQPSNKLSSKLFKASCPALWRPEILRLHFYIGEKSHRLFDLMKGYWNQSKDYTTLALTSEKWRRNIRCHQRALNIFMLIHTQGPRLFQQHWKKSKSTKGTLKDKNPKSWTDHSPPPFFFVQGIFISFAIPPGGKLPSPVY